VKELIICRYKTPVLLDDEDYFNLKDYYWRLGTNGYVLRSIGQLHVYMHRQIMKPAGDLEVDHIDGNRLNNQRLNLRCVTKSINGQNRKLQVNNTSGYRGVTFQQGSWKAQIYKDKKRICLGCYPSKIEAAEAYNLAAVLLFGPLAKLNDLSNLR